MPAGYPDIQMLAGIAGLGFSAGDRKAVYGFSDGVGNAWLRRAWLRNLEEEKTGNPLRSPNEKTDPLYVTRKKRSSLRSPKTEPIGSNQFCVNRTEPH